MTPKRRALNLSVIFYFDVCDLFSISRIFNIVIRASVDNSNFVFIITDSEGITLF